MIKGSVVIGLALFDLSILSYLTVQVMHYLVR